MDHNYLDILVWIFLFALLVAKTSGSCVADSDCPDANTACISGICQCEEGYTFLNGKCSQVVGRTCLDNVDCDDGRTECVDSRCQCRSLEWTNENGKCVSYYGKTCATWLDCGVALGYECVNNICNCSIGYKHRNRYCIKVLGSICSQGVESTECPIDHSSCQRRNTVQSICKCLAGYTEKNDICIQVLGASCDDVTCGNTLAQSYFYLSSGWWSASSWTGSSDHLHMTCTADNVCSCNQGFVADGIFCTPVVGKTCSQPSDCGTYPGYICNMQTNTCGCSTHFRRIARVWYNITDTNDLLPDEVSVGLCIPEIGQNCSTVNCFMEHSQCNNLNKCVCADGYTETKTVVCQPVLGMSCIRETLCQIVDGGVCGEHNLCVCKEGFVQNGSICVRVLSSVCASSNDCLLNNSKCVDGVCKCLDGFTENNSKCLKNDCVKEVRYLPDLHRRSMHRYLVKDEQPIDDSLLVEGWYSIGKHTLYAGNKAPETGFCSTYHPVYLKENLTDNQIDMMKEVNVSVNATVGRLEIFNRSESISIHLRKCGKDTYIYIKPPQTHFSALCIFSTDGDIRIAKSNRLHALVFQDLLFERKVENNRTKRKPYLVFSCLPSEVKSYSTRSLYPHSFLQNEDDIFFYYVHWYLNDIHFKSFGPVRKRHFITETSIFETELFQMGYKVGFQARCSFEVTEDPNGKTVLLANSINFLTGFDDIQIFRFINRKEDSDIPLVYYINTPLGCETFDDGYNESNCELEWSVVDSKGDPACNITQSGQPDRKQCIFSLRGYTYKEYVNRTRPWDGSNEQTISMSNHTHTISITEEFLTKFEAIDGSDDWHLEVKVSPTDMTTGHDFWNEYNFRSITGHIYKDYYAVGIRTCSISKMNVPIISGAYFKDGSPESQGSVAVDEVGEFLLFRSRASPVEIHIETEKCLEAFGKICVCGITYRNGGDIYVNSNCNGLTRVKHVFGNKTNANILRPDRVIFDNGVMIHNVSIQPYFNIYTMQEEDIIDSGEGLCAFRQGSYRHRGGIVMSTSERFVSSWKTPVEESLYNPRNHRTFKWSHKYISCYCPSDAKEREVVYHHNYTSNGHTNIREIVSVYRGFFRCSIENTCSREYTGDDWPDSLQPPTVVMEVTARMEVHFHGIMPLLHLFCDFKTQKGHFYTIKWHLDGELAYETTAMSAEDAEGFYVTNDDIKTSKFLLEAAFSCEVGIYDDSQSTVLELINSKQIKAVEFAKTEVLLLRGRDATIQLKLNVPLVCKKNTPCHFHFKLFDPSETHNCSDSTLAIKDPNTCGTRIAGVISDAGLINKGSIVNITLTTKNNNLYTLRNTFTVQMKLVTNGATNTYQERTFSKNITIFVRDDESYWKRNYCYANNDPRMRTFDGQYYSNILVDEFVMMKHKKLPVEVQLETNYWGWYSCGVTVRAGRDVFTVNHCHGDHITGYLLADDKILRVNKRDEHRYQIYLPHGTLIDVRISTWGEYMVNVYIYPSPADMKQVEGLCGNFDGNVQGDLIHSDGKITHASDYYWWWHVSDPVDFIRSWGLNSTLSKEISLSNIDVIQASLQSWPDQDVLCVCTGTNGNGEVKCSASEQKTCLSPVDTPGEEISVSVRQKRSGHVLDKEYKQRMRKLKERRDAYRDSELRVIHPRSVRDVEAAIASCNQTLSSTCNIMTVKDNGLNVTFDELLYNCGEDRAANPNTDWTALTCQAMEANVEKELRVDVQFKNENPDYVSSILTNLCVGNCSGNGKCNQGVCECFDGYTANDCSLDLSKTVVIKSVTGDGICDISQKDCACIRLTTSGSSVSSMYSLDHKQFTSDGKWTHMGISKGTVVYDNFNEVFVCPEIKRKLRSTSKSLPVADQYIIALSNDNTTFGNSSTVFVIDSTCLKVSNIYESYTIELMPGFCVIGGICYITKAKSPSDSCMICEESFNPYDWSADKSDACQDSKKINDEDSISAYALGLYIGAACFVGIAVITIIISVVCSKRKFQRG